MENQIDIFENKRNQIGIFPLDIKENFLPFNPGYEPVRFPYNKKNFFLTEKVNKKISLIDDIKLRTNCLKFIDILCAVERRAF